MGKGQIKGQIQSLAEQLPSVLRSLLEAELAAGNEVTALESGFPAPPAGFCLMLEHPLQTRWKSEYPDLIYREWPNWKGYRGVTDLTGHFFLLEPPLPPLQDPVMRYGPDGIASAPGRASPQEAPTRPSTRPRMDEPGPPSMGVFWPDLEMDYEKWHDGLGHDLEALNALPEPEKKAVEAHLIQRGIRDWRDVEALASLDGDAARAALREALAQGELEVRLAVARQKPAWLTPSSRTALLVEALEQAAPFAGLTPTVDAVVDFHPPAVMAALWRCLEDREGDVAVHYAALLTYLHGVAQSPFDMALRPFFLTFNTADAQARRAAISTLRDKITLEGSPEP